MCFFSTNWFGCGQSRSPCRGTNDTKDATTQIRGQSRCLNWTASLSVNRNNEVCWDWTIFWETFFFTWTQRMGLTHLPLITLFMFFCMPTGPPVFCYGVCEWWRPNVPHPTSGQVQGTSSSVRSFFFLRNWRLMLYIKLLQPKINVSYFSMSCFLLFFCCVIMLFFYSVVILWTNYFIADFMQQRSPLVSSFFTVKESFIGVY